LAASVRSTLNVFALRAHAGRDARAPFGLLLSIRFKTRGARVAEVKGVVFEVGRFHLQR